MVPRGKDGEGIVRECGMDMDTRLCLTWRTSKALLSSTGDSAQSSVITLWFPGGRMGEGIVRESGMDMDTLLHLTSRTSKDQHRELCSMSCGSLDGRGVWGYVWIHVYVWLSPFTVHLKLSQHG